MIPIKFEKRIYISHAFGGKRKNLKNTTKRILELVKAHPTYLFISPIHSFSYLYRIDDYNLGLSRCLDLLKDCDELWVTGKNFDKSVGVKEEIKYANKHGIKVVYKLKPEEYDSKKIHRFFKSF